MTQSIVRIAARICLLAILASVGTAWGARDVMYAGGDPPTVIDRRGHASSEANDAGDALPPRIAPDPSCPSGCSPAELDANEDGRSWLEMLGLG
jgi:hypothetical protein